MTPDNNPAWRPSTVAVALLTAVLLLCSWWLPATRITWDRMDHAVFHLLNDSLADGGAWSIFWSIANWRPFDLVGGFIILALAFGWLRQSRRSQLQERAVALIVFGSLLILTNLLVQFVQELLDYNRHSPSLVIEGAIRLSDQVDWIDMKDSSKDSFPGDHAFVILSAIAFFWHHAGWRRGLTALLLLLPLIFPRLVGGAHWITDVTIGAIPMMLLCCALWYGSPLRGIFVGTLCRWTLPLFTWIERRCLPLAPKANPSGGDHESVL